MRASIKAEFGRQKPRAIVLDDNAKSRVMISRRLKDKGFEVVECDSPTRFREEWEPGMFDVIISDWELTHSKDEAGDVILAAVRRRDWDVPFVLVSGKLGEAGDRADVLEHLLDSGSAGFVERGGSGIRKACDLAEDLIERRDLALLKMILAIRPAALANEAMLTTYGPKSAQDTLGELVSQPALSHKAGRPIAKARGRRAAASK